MIDTSLLMKIFGNGAVGQAAGAGGPMGFAQMMNGGGLSGSGMQPPSFANSGAVAPSAGLPTGAPSPADWATTVTPTDGISSPVRGPFEAGGLGDMGAAFKQNMSGPVGQAIAKGFGKNLTETMKPNAASRTPPPSAPPASGGGQGQQAMGQQGMQSLMQSGRRGGAATSPALTSGTSAPGPFQAMQDGQQRRLAGGLFS